MAEQIPVLKEDIDKIKCNYDIRVPKDLKNQEEKLAKHKESLIVYIIICNI